MATRQAVQQQQGADQPLLMLSPPPKPPAVAPGQVQKARCAAGSTHLQGLGEAVGGRQALAQQAQHAAPQRRPSRLPPPLGISGADAR